MWKILFILWESWAGKTSLENVLIKDYGYRTLDKLSSRPPRNDGSGYMHFPAREIADMYVDGLVQECIKYDGNFYAMRIPSHKETDKFVVVITESGLQQFIDMGIEDMFEVQSIFLTNPKCEKNMRKRWDSEESIQSRLKLNERMKRWRWRHIEIDASCETSQLVTRIQNLLPTFF